MPHNQLTQNLIRTICTPVSILLRHKPLIHNLLRLRITPLEQRLPDDRQTLSRIRIGIIHLGTTPKRYFIQDNMLLSRIAVSHHTHSTITHRQHLLPNLRRLIIAQNMLGVIQPLAARK